jgi:hypothetical protein
MSLSQAQKKEMFELLGDDYTSEEIKLLIEIKNEYRSDKKLTKETYNKIMQVGPNRIDIYVEHFEREQLVDFLKMYKKDRYVSIDEYYRLCRFAIWDRSSYEALYHRSSFRKKYGYPVPLFYFLHELLNLSYRDLENLSGLNKDTINRYVNFYEDALELQNKATELRLKASQLEHQKTQIVMKM